MLYEAKRKNARRLAALAGGMVLYSGLCALASRPAHAGILSASALVFVLLVVRERLLEYRIMNGLFGTNAYEARRMVQFMVANAESLDLPRGPGDAAQVLLPEQLIPRWQQEFGPDRVTGAAG